MSSSEPNLGCGQVAWPESSEPSNAWDEHLRACAECRRDTKQIDDLFAGVLSLAPSQALEDRVMNVIERDLSPDTSWALSVLLGATLALIASVLAASRHALVGETGALTIAIAGVAWTGAFSVVVHTLRNAKRGPWSVLPLIVAIMAILALPTPSEDRVCAACDVVGLGLTTARLMFVIAGACVGLGLTSLVNRLLPGTWRGWQRAMIAAGVVLASVGPALFLACAPFSVGSLVGVFGGLTAGVLVSAGRGLGSVSSLS